MSAFDEAKIILRPLFVPSAAVVALLVVSAIQFSEARSIKVPPAPDTLFVERVRIDAVRHTLEPMGQSGPTLRTSVAVRLATSDDWPGLTFRFEGTASGVSIIPPVTFDLHLAQDVREAAERHRQWPNVFPSLIVHGVSENGQMLVDPEQAHNAAENRKGQSELFGWIALIATILPGFMLYSRGRVLWDRHMA